MPYFMSFFEPMPHGDLYWMLICILSIYHMQRNFHTHIFGEMLCEFLRFQEISSSFIKWIPWLLFILHRIVALFCTDKHYYSTSVNKISLKWYTCLNSKSCIKLLNSLTIWYILYLLQSNKIHFQAKLYYVYIDDF